MEWKPEDKKILKNTLQTATPAALMVAAIWIAALFLDIKIIILFLIGLMVVPEAVKSIRHGQRYDIRKVFNNLAYLALIVILVFLLNVLFGGKGLIAFLVAGLILSAVLLFRRRKQYMYWVKHIENKLYGMSLEEYKRGKKHERKR